MSALVIQAVVNDGDIHVVDSFYKSRRQRAAKRWGQGTAVVIRIEPAESAWKHAAAKHLYGHLYKPVSDRTGETVAEVHLRMKAQFMPDDGRTSITELDESEMKAFTESVEQDIRENDPASWEDCLAVMALYERRSA
jgi:hypothetical protein